ncbi:glycosyltransferase [Parvularcula lutaonensis]|uniref:Glycosyltransferase n=1 Tax=Parvularcula lutaonensis TaxID=491923 RepID=A0ABV7M941_9PROT|nr:glycosyltransferase [Parvularcula lutaonensis]GGY46236.1 glycosyl transferase [Parvularcula lutaonensis]
MLALTLLSFVIWLFLLFGRGGFWRADIALPAAKEPERWPGVAVVIPARDEAETIARVVEAHRNADYPGALQVFLADDHSSDGTADKARATEGSRALHIVPVGDLPEGWSGKLWALNAGLAAAEETMPDADYVLFTDADIVCDRGLVRKLVAHAEREKLALASIMARLDASGFWGGLLVPAFVFFFQKLYPFAEVCDPRSKVAGAAGGVVLLRRSALEAIDGLEAMRGALIDDCTLAARVKATGRKIGLYHSSPFAQAVSLRKNDSYRAMETMVARTAYTQLDHNPLMLAGTLVGMFVIYLAAPLAVLFGDGDARMLGLLVWALMAFAYMPTLKRYGRRRWEALGLPLAAAVFVWFTCLSAWRHWQGRGGEWKGRSYPARKPS